MNKNAIGFNCIFFGILRQREDLGNEKVSSIKSDNYFPMAQMSEVTLSESNSEDVSPAVAMR